MWFVFMLAEALLFIAVAVSARTNTIKHSNISILVVLCLLFICAVITQSFLLSTLFGNANVAAAAGGVINVILVFIPYDEPFKSTFIFLIPQVAFKQGLLWIGDWETLGEGAHWSNVNVREFGTEGALYLDEPLSTAMWMMAVDIGIHIILTWYLEAVFPEYGIPQPLYFFLMPSYWCGTSSFNDKFLNAVDDTPEEMKGFLEPEPSQLPLGVAVRKLKKTYSNGKVALQGVTLNFYESQITSFLGQNGAGKTTTISIISGLFPPSDGTVFVNGKDVRKQIDEIRQSLGLCPQHDILYDMLTVNDHLQFYAGLRGVPPKQTKLETMDMLEELSLTQYANVKAKALSGGIKRRLSVASAFIGGPKVVVLDEPTTGMDPKGKRFVWGRIRELVQDGKTSVILTSHGMEECEALCGRIGIMVRGRFRCLGSNQHLKSRFGQGYTLTMKLGGAKPKTAEAIEFVTTRLPGAELKEQHLNQVRFKLPPTIRALSDVFACMVEATSTLGVEDYTISQTTLEDVFISFADEVYAADAGVAHSSKKKSDKR